MFYWFVQITVGFLARIFFGLDTEGLENIPGCGSFIIVSNHRSHLDPPMIAAAITRKLFFMTKAELFEGRLFGLILKRLNCIRLDRNGVGRAALKEGLRALHKSKGLLIFPEGTRSKDGKIGSGKAGAAVFAFATGAPVIPAFITGTEKAMPPNRHLITPAKVKIVFGKGLMPSSPASKEDRKQAYQDFTDRIMREIAHLEKEAA